MKTNNLKAFRKGVIDGIPVFLGYIAVSFTFGITAKKAGLPLLHTVLMSATNLTSAGQFAGVTLITACAAYLELAVTQFIVNSRYILMSCALSQKVDPKTSFIKRAIMAFGISDEIFGLSISVEGRLNPYYTFGAMFIGITGWTLGTFMGAASGNILPDQVVSALGIALYGMLINIIIPPAKTNKVLQGVIIISMIMSFVFSITPFLKNISTGVKMILLTVLITGIAAKLFPIKEQSNEK